ncbi:peptidoglycan-binding domain-containing protein [Branchiibius cervicis]|uniref:Peptidoglycan-binding protein n=1 Tax=Branchiibius cervicis TaxID=908252 RepID=A0ABW2AXW6_9MICO
MNTNTTPDTTAARPARTPQSKRRLVAGLTLTGVAAAAICGAAAFGFSGSTAHAASTGTPAATHTISPATPVTPHTISPATPVTPSNHHTHPTAGGSSVKPSASVKQLQRELGQLDYYEGPVDGISGTQTINAIKYLQRDAHLPQTGIMNQATSNALKAMLAHGNNVMGGNN